MKPLIPIHFLLMLTLLASGNTSEEKRTLAIRYHDRLSKEQAVTYFNRTKRTMTQAVVPIYSMDFSGGIPTTWSNIDSAGHGRRWYFSNNECFRCDSIYSGSGIDSLSVQGTSSANGIAMYDSDSAGASIGGDYGVLTTAAINCSGYTAVHLQFNELFIYCNDLTIPAYQNTARVYVSNDNINYYLFHQAEYGLFNCGESTNNPNPVDIDITAIAANRSTVYVRFSFTGDYSYWWFIDDVALIQPSPYDAAVTGIHPLFNGCTLSAAEQVTIDLKNCGTQSISNFQVSYTVNGGAPVTESVNAALQPNGTMSYTFNQTANLSGPSTYQIIASVNLSNDAYALNNRDTLNTFSIPPFTLPYSNSFENPYDEETLTLIDADNNGRTPFRNTVAPHTGSYCLEIPSAPQSQFDDWFFTSCLDLNPASMRLDYWTKRPDLTWNFILDVYLCNAPSPSDTLFHLHSAATAVDTNYQSNTCVFTAPNAGIYYLGFHCTGNNITTPLYFDDLLLDFLSNSGTLYHENEVVLFPNPCGNEIRLDIKNKLMSVSQLGISDETGRTVLTQKVSGQQTIQVDLSGLSKGSYVLTVTTAEGVIRRKLIKSE